MKVISYYAEIPYLSLNNKANGKIISYLIENVFYYYYYCMKVRYVIVLFKFIKQNQ